MSDAASIVTAYLDAWNRRDWAAYRQLHSDDFTHADRHGTVVGGGPNAAVAGAQSWIAAFPDAVLELQHVHAAGEVAIYEAVGRATHRGTFMGVAPTGAKIALPVCNVLTIRDGKVVNEREYLDRLTLLEQLGAAK